MWKKNTLGADEFTPTKQQRPRSGWAPHPETGETVWYDAKNDTYRDKFGGPARDALSIGWQMIGGKRAENAARLLIKGGKKVIPAAYKADKASREAKGKMMDKTLTDTKKLAKELLVSKTSPSVMGYKDTTGITKGREAVENDVKNLKPSPTEKNPTVVTGNESNKKKIMITQEQIHRALRNSGE
tara:strand:+ start:37 stop:591 length:555 start_codon:yes stop_codon:yes gene_type:complete